MRTPILTALVIAALMPLGASAQQRGTGKVTLSLGSTGEQSEEGGGPPEGSATVAPDDKEAKTEAPGAKHTVEKGDTLWDLSKRYLGSHWYWPKVWSYNPEIANPHWIYPGNVVRFFGTGEETPTEVEVGAGPEVADVEEGELVDDGDKVVVAGKIGYQPKRALTITAPGFLTTREIEEAGTIVGSFAEQDMLTYPCQAYVEFTNKRSAKLGESFIVFRTTDEIYHPIKKNSVGYLTRIVGEMRVVRLDGPGKVTMAISRQFDEIRRGDKIGPMGEPLTNLVAARANDREIKGAMVLTSSVPYQTIMAETMFVVIDKGGDDGVKIGNSFTIWRQNDLQSQAVMLNPTLQDEQYPREDVASCLAVDVKAKATTCMLYRSIRDVVRGDQAEMRTSSAKAASR